MNAIERGVKNIIKKHNIFNEEFVVENMQIKNEGIISDMLCEGGYYNIYSEFQRSTLDEELEKFLKEKGFYFEAVNACIFDIVEL